MNHFIWWIKNTAMAVLSVFFLVLGVETLLASYGLTNPLTFIMTFFSASLIILMSLIGVIYPVHQVYRLLKSRR